MAESSTEVLPWLKSLPVAPEYHPTLAEFQDPISYIFKIEKEASKYGICKIVPPVLLGPRKTAIANLNKSLAARPDSSGSANPKSQPTFTTRQQQIGFCPRRPRPVQKPVWQSGEYYTVQQFEAKAKNFEKNYLKKCSKKGSFSALEIETLYWKASVDKPFSVEYANDMPGSAFVPLNSRKGRREVSEGVTVGDTEWNMRGVSRAKGSLLRFMKEEIPGVTSPMVYIAMLFSWFAWHVEDHDLHSLNYMHMGAGKTWYGVPRDAAVAVEEVIRVHGYGGEVNPLVTLATLGEKTTVMSPEVFKNAGVPCCRLVQNAGEFVVTFPRAYHSGFSHGFNCSEAANIATPEWLTVAKDAAIRRASITYSPMVSHIQLLYDLALELCSRIPTMNNSEPRSSRLKDKKKGEGETMVKEQFVQNVTQNNDLLHALGKGSRIVLLPLSSSDISVCSNLRVGELRPRLSLGSMKASDGLVQNSTAPERNQEKHAEGFYPVKGKFASFYGRSKVSSSIAKDDLCPITSQPPNIGNVGLSDQRLFSCLTCGVLTFDCVAIIQPTEPAAKYLMTADCTFFNNWIVGSGDDADDPVQTADYRVQTPDRSNGVPDTEIQRDTSALGLLASTYEISSDSEEEQGEQDASFIADETILRHCSSGNKCEFDSDRSSPTRNYRSCESGAHNLPPSRSEKGIEVPVPGDVKNTSFTPRSDEDSSRMHVFCLEHAKEVEQKLRSIGGVNMLLLCHPDYPKVEAEAKLVAQELGIDYLWKDTMFKDATKEDEERIRSAMDDEEAIPGNGDWAVKLGINLYYSANLSRSSLYSKQMPYNSVIYNAFGCSSPASSPTKPNVYRRRSDKQRKVVGKWCGKVWMSNQVHPVLVQKNSDDQEHDKSFVTGTMSDMKAERNLERAPKSEGTKTYGRKRKMAVESASTKKIKSSKQDVSGSDDLLGNTHQQSCRRIPKSKQAKGIEREDAVSEDLLSRNSQQQRRSLRNKQSKFIERKGAVSDDVMDDVANRQLRPLTRGKRTKHIEVEDTVSDGSLEDDTLSRGKKDIRIQKYGAISNDSGDDSHQQGTYIEEDVVSDDSLEHRSHWELWRGSIRSKQGQHVETEVSDDSMEHNSLQQYRRALLGKQAKYFGKADAMSDDSLECDSLEQQSSESKQFRPVESVSDDSLDDDTLLRDSTCGKQAKLTDEGEDAVSDDSLEFKSLQQHRMTLRGKQNKKIGREDAVSNVPLKHNSLQQSRTLRGKQAKHAKKEEAVSDDSLEHSCQGKRVVRGKQIKQVNSEGTKQGISQTKKMPRVMKKEPPLDSYVEEGGPSTRLRKRTQRAIEEEVETKHKVKQQKGKKKVKNTSTGKTLINRNAAAKDDEEDYQCDIEGCGMSFESKQELVLHKRNVCPVKGCGKKFFSHKYLVQHRRVHVDDRPLKCPWKGCKMSFKWAWARTEHIRVHTGARPYVCMESGCGQTFRFVSDFSRHKRKTGHSTKKGRR